MAAAVRKLPGRPTRLDQEHGRALAWGLLGEVPRATRNRAGLGQSLARQVLRANIEGGEHVEIEQQPEVAAELLFFGEGVLQGTRLEVRARGFASALEQLEQSAIEIGGGTLVRFAAEGLGAFLVPLRPHAARGLVVGPERFDPGEHCVQRARRALEIAAPQRVETGFHGSQNRVVTGGRGRLARNRGRRKD